MRGMNKEITKQMEDEFRKIGLNVEELKNNRNESPFEMTD